MNLILIQTLNGLASASSLFLVASGLSIIFGVTRVVNFAHGSFYMLGAYIAWSLVTRFAPAGALGFWGGVLLLTGWMVFLALGDILSTATHAQASLARMKAQQRELQDELNQLRRKGSNGQQNSG